MNKNLSILPFFILALLCSCGGGKKEQTTSDPEEKMDRREKLRFNQYKVKGKELYAVKCAACHQVNGEGLASLYPPLKESDYLLEDLARAACIVKNGQTDEIIVNGETYSTMMPPVSDLSPLEIAEIITYITNEWGNSVGLTDVKTVEGWLAACE